MRARLRQALSLTQEEMARLEALTQVATSRKIEIPESATNDEAEVFLLLTLCVGRIAPSHFQNIKRYLEASMLMAGLEPGAVLKKQEERVM